jgi:hypothetical protein
MPYTTGTLTYLAGGLIEGAWKLWEYTTADTLAQVTAPGYIVDATFKGMNVGDFVIVVNQAIPQGYILQVQNLTPGTLSVPGAASLVAPAGVGGPLLAFPRNIIDGGDFTTNPWQRGTSFTGIANTVTYTADRFFAVGGASSAISVSQVTGVAAVPGFSQALQIGRAAGNASTAVISLGQVVETLDSIRLQGQTVTLSFWAQAGANWSPANGVLNVLLASGTGVNQSAANLAAAAWTGFTQLTLAPQQNLSPNSSPGAAVLTPGANIGQQITASWQRYSFTATVPAGCTQLGLMFNATPTGTAGAADFVQDPQGIEIIDGVTETACAAAPPGLRFAAGNNGYRELRACSDRPCVHSQCDEARHAGGIPVRSVSVLVPPAVKARPGLPAEQIAPVLVWRPVTHHRVEFVELARVLARQAIRRSTGTACASCRPPKLASSTGSWQVRTR